MSLNIRFFLETPWHWSIVVFFIALALLVVLSYSLQSSFVLQADHMILEKLHALKTPFLDYFFSTVTWMGSLWVLIPLYLVLTILLTPHIEHFEKIVGITFWGSVITVYLLKYELERKRPHLFASFNALPIDPSFPSAHTVQITAFALGVWIAVGTQSSYQPILLSFLIFAVLSVMLSRLYLQVHFPTDVIAGLLVALMWAMIAIWVVKTEVLK